MLNRKELLVTFSTKEQARVREILAGAGIDYTYKVVNRNSASPVYSQRAHTGTFGENPDMAYEYVIYVHKSDFDQARHLLF